MRLLQAMAGAPHGGAEAFFTRLAVAFAKRGVDQRVVIRPQADRLAALESAGVPVVTQPFGGFFDRRTTRGLRREIARWRPRVALTWMNRATRLFPRRTAGSETLHVARLGGYYDLKYYRHCDHLVGNTPDIVDYLVAQGWPAARAHYLPNFVFADAMPPVPRGSLNTPDGAPLLLALGRLHTNKGFDVLLDALPHLPDRWLWLAGTGPLEASLKSRAERLGVLPRVRFLGWRDDVPALLAAADVLVCPSRHEPLGNVVIEAWAHAVPVVAAAATGPAHMIDDGKTGLLVPIEDAAALAEAIDRAQGRCAADLVAAGHAAFEANYTEEAVVDRYLAFFDTVAG